MVMTMKMRMVLIGGVARSFPGSRAKQPATNIDVDEDGGDDDDGEQGDDAHKDGG